MSAQDIDDLEALRAARADTSETIPWEEFLAQLEVKPWSGPYAHYCEDSDSLSVWFADESYYGEWTGLGITLYIGQESQQIVGGRFSRIKQRLEAARAKRTEELKGRSIWRRCLERLRAYTANK